MSDGENHPVCPVTLGTTYVIDGTGDFPCERPAGHTGPHERWSQPIAAQWDEGTDGRSVKFASAAARPLPRRRKPPAT